MKKLQFTQLKAAQEHLKQAYAILEKLNQEEIKEEYLKRYMTRAEDLIFETLVSNVNKVEHDIMHIGVEK